MKLVDWRKREGLTQVELAARLAVTQPRISTAERPFRPDPPAPDLMKRIYLLTGGEVQPNDFYDLPRLDGQEEFSFAGCAELRAA